MARSMHEEIFTSMSAAQQAPCSRSSSLRSFRATTLSSGAISSILLVATETTTTNKQALTYSQWRPTDWLCITITMIGAAAVIAGSMTMA